MQMTGHRVLPVPPEQAWAALNDPEMLKACIPGCESIAATEPLRYELVMAARIGPVSARFKGRLVQSDVVEPQSYRIDFDGQGGAAGFGKGSAQVRLSPQDAGTRLDYDVTAQIGGKLAQVGSRLVDSAAKKIADEFFSNFEQRLAERAASAAPDHAATPDAMATRPDAMATTPVPQDGAAPPGDTAGPARDGDREASLAHTQRNRWIGWVVGIAVALALLVWYTR